MPAPLARLLAVLLSPVLLLTVLAGAFVLVRAPQHIALSPLDEYVYLDYLSKVPTQGFVRTGEETGDVARQAIACRGVETYGLYGDQCRSITYDQDGLYPYNGQTGADIYAPLYFMVTWLLAQPLVAVGVDLLDAGRLVGIFWLALGLCLLSGLLRSLRVPPGISLGLSMLVIPLPVTYWSTTYVSTDAPSLAVAAGFAWLGVAVVRKRMPILVLPLAGAAAVLFKLQNLAIVGVVLLAILLWTGFRGSTDTTGNERGRLRGLVDFIREPVVRGSFLTVLAVVVAEGAWLAFRSSQALRGAPRAQIDSVQQVLTPSTAVMEAFKFLQGVGGAGPSPNAVGLIASGSLTLLAAAAVVGAVIRWQSSPRIVAVVAASTLLVALVTGPALALATSIVVGYYTPLPPRYGFSLLPAFVLNAGFLLSDGAPLVVRAIPWVGTVAAVLAIVT